MIFMEIDYQVVVNLVASIMLVSFPIALIFMICQKLVGIFVAFVFGKEISF